MTCPLDTQEITNSQPVKDTQVTTIADKSQYEQTLVNEKPLKELKVQVSKEEDKILSPIPLTVEA